MDPRHIACYKEWVQVQTSDLEELAKVYVALNQAKEAGTAGPTDADHGQVVEKCMKHFEDYYWNRRRLIPEGSLSFFTAPWCSLLESSFFWIGGCRPSLFFHHLYTLSKIDLEKTDVQENINPVVALMGLSSNQHNLISELQEKTINVENELTERLTRLQKYSRDKPLLQLMFEKIAPELQVACKLLDMPSSSSGDKKVEETMDSYAVELGKIVGEADHLRLVTAREFLLNILTPQQAVEMLLATKQLHLSVSGSGHRRDLEHGGRNNE